MDCFKHIETMLKMAATPLERRHLADLIMHYIGSEIIACYSPKLHFLNVSSDFTVSKLLTSGKCNFGYTDYTQRNYVSGETCHFGTGFYKCIHNTSGSPSTCPSDWNPFSIEFNAEISYIMRNSSVYNMDDSITNGFDRRCDVFSYDNNRMLFTYSGLTSDYMLFKCYAASSFEDYLNTNNIYNHTRNKLLINMEKTRQLKMYTPHINRDDITSKVYEISSVLFGTASSTVFSGELYKYVTEYMSGGNHMPIYLSDMNGRGCALNELMKRVFPTSVETSSYNRVTKFGSMLTDRFNHYDQSYLISNYNISKNNIFLGTSNPLYANSDKTRLTIPENEKIRNELGVRTYVSSNNYAHFYGFSVGINFSNQKEYFLGANSSATPSSIQKFISVTMTSEYAINSFINELTSDHYFSTTAKSAYFDEVYDIIFPS